MSQAVETEEKLTDRTAEAQGTSITGRKADVNPKSLGNLSVHDDSSTNSSAPSDSRDEERKEDNTQCFEAQQDLMKLRQKKEFDSGPVVLRTFGTSTASLNAFKLLQYIWPSQYSLDEVSRYIEDLANVPYMETCLKKDLDKVREILRRDASRRVAHTVDTVVLSSEQENTDLSAEDEMILKALPDEKMRELFRQHMKQRDELHRQEFKQKEILLQEIKQKDELHRQEIKQKDELHRQKDELRSIRESILRTLHVVETETREVKYQLLHLAGMRKAESSCSHKSTTAHTIESPGPNKKQKIDERSEIFVLAEPNSVVSSIMKNCLDIDEKDVLPGLCEVSKDGSKTGAEARLAKVVEQIEGYLTASTFLVSDDLKYKQKVEDAIKKVRREIRIAPSESRSDDCCSEVATSSEQKTETFAPGPVAHEKEGAQPWIELLFKSVGACWEPSTSMSGTEVSSSMSGSPKKTAIQKEAPMLSTENRHKRSIDFLLRKEGRWEAVVFDDNLTIPIEAKPGCRKGWRPMELLNEAVDQVLSRLAKYLLNGFNFAGYGVPCHNTGIVVCMGAIQILHLRYENVGTPDAKLVLYKSALMPLMKADNFQRWADASGRKKRQQFDDLKTKLYGSNGNDGIDSRGIPMGIRALFNLLNQEGKKLYGLSIDITANTLKLPPLGSGATGIVFKSDSSHCDSCVVKLSRYGSKQGIENEKNILQKLAMGSNAHLPHLAKCDAIDENGRLQITLGSVKAALPAIALSPAGQSATLYLSKPSTDTNTTLRLILNGVTAALSHIHDQDICHCDVTPQNIIIVQGREPPKAVLIDFSIATASGRPMRGFHGTPDYAHREIFSFHLHGRREFRFHPVYDKAGLGFSMAYFVNKCIRPWDAKHARSVKQPTLTDVAVLEDAMDERIEIAEDVIKTVKESDLKGDIAKLLSLDNATSDAAMLTLDND